MKNTYTYNTLIKLAAEVAGLEHSEIRSHNVSLLNDFYHVTVISGFNSYECIIDPDSLHVEGIISEPSGEGLFDLYKHYCA